MGLFDRIKKSIFGDKKEKEEQRDLDQDQLEKNEKQDSQEQLPSGSKTNLTQSENGSEQVIEEQDKQEEPGWGDAGSLFEQRRENLTSNEDQAATKKHAEEDGGVSDETNEPETSDLNEAKDEEPGEAADINENEQVSDEKSTNSDEESTQERYDRGLEKTNHSFGAKLNAFFAKFRSVDEDFFDELEDLLIESDVGFETAEQLTDSLRDEAKLQNAKSHDDLKRVIVEKMVELYDKGGQGKDSSLAYDPSAKPNVYLFVGVNGAGKTTTIGKLAKRLKDSGKSVMMVAADTFRAGAVEQLVEWGKRDGVEVITGPEKADPASVVYDGVSKAKAQGIDYLLVDTAGRLQNKVNLMKELDKIERTIKKIIPDQPNEVLLVLDGSTGQNALLQAKDFNKTTELTGLVLTKLDGSSKGGVVIAIRNEMDLPVKLVGLGEKVDDLADFDAEKFAVGLFQGLV